MVFYYSCHLILCDHWFDCHCYYVTNIGYTKAPEGIIVLEPS